jgi:hypothetical protein
MITRALSVDEKTYLNTWRKWGQWGTMESHLQLVTLELKGIQELFALFFNFNFKIISKLNL